MATAVNDDGCDLSCATGENHPPEQKNKVYDETRTSFDGQLICGLGVRTCALTFLLVSRFPSLGTSRWCIVVSKGRGHFVRAPRCRAPTATFLHQGIRAADKNRPDILTCCGWENLYKLQHCAGCGVYRPPRCTRCCVCERRPPLPVDPNLQWQAQLLTSTGVSTILVFAMTLTQDGSNFGTMLFAPKREASLTSWLCCAWPLGGVLSVLACFTVTSCAWTRPTHERVKEVTMVAALSIRVYAEAARTSSVAGFGQGTSSLRRVVSCG